MHPRQIGLGIGHDAEPPALGEEFRPVVSAAFCLSNTPSVAQVVQICVQEAAGCKGKPWQSDHARL